MLQPSDQAWCYTDYSIDNNTNTHADTQSDLGIRNGSKAFLLELLDCLLIISKIKFCAYQDDGGVGTMMTNFRVPLQSKQKNEKSDSDLST